MAQRTCQYCGVPITGRQRTKCSADACRKAYNNERTARFNAKWKQEHGQRYGAKYNPTRKHTARARQCEACGKTYQTTRPAGRACSLTCRWFISPQTVKSSQLAWHQCRSCLRWLARPGQRHCSAACRERPPAAKAKRRRWVMGVCTRCGSDFVAVDYTFDPRCLPHTCSVLCARREANARRRVRKHDAYVAPVYRQRIFERDRWRCQLCGKKVRRTAKVPHPLAPVIDHIVPLARGGTHEPKNVQCAHYLCNAIKSDGGTDQLLLFG